MITIESVSKLFGRRAALDRVSLTIEPGEVTLLLGANGAGKSTLLRCLLGITDFQGAIRVNGRDPLKNGREVRAQIGYMPQTGGLHPDLTVEETLRFYAEIRQVALDRVPVLLNEANLTDHATVRVGELSGGMRQRLGFAVALLTDPSILILDEPNASLDRASRDWLAQRLEAAAAEGRTVIASTHADRSPAGAFRAITLEDGRVISDMRMAMPGSARSNSQRRAHGGGEGHEGATGTIGPIVRKELGDALRSKWIVGYAALLAVLGFAAAVTGINGSSGLALQAFGRTTATLMNLCLLLAPLVAVLMGAASVAGERERGTLEHLLAQPLTRHGLLLGKHAGLLIALTAATLAGFLPAGVLIAWSVGPAVLPHYLVFPLIASLVGAAMAGVGLLVSVSCRSAVQAQGTAVFVWFAFVLLYDLLLMGSLALSGLKVELLSILLLANPVDAARVLGVLALEPDLYLLGPAGAYLASQLSRGGTAVLLVLTLLAWVVGPLALALIRFSVHSWRISRVQEIPLIVRRQPGDARSGDRVLVGAGKAS
jgi:Cu-processing system permease protein